MLKDDRMMSMLTFVAGMLAVGIFSQRLEILAPYFGEETVALSLMPDQAIMRPGAPIGIDVLANDHGIRDSDAGSLIILEQPACGNAYVGDGQANYIPLENCTGSQTFRYSLFGRGTGQAAEVTVTIRMDDPAQNDIAANAQRDIALPTPAKLRALPPRATVAPSLQAAEAAIVSATFMPPAAPTRPQAPVISGRPDLIPAADRQPVTGISLAGSGLTPIIALVNAGSTETMSFVSLPVIPQPGWEPNPETHIPPVQASWTARIAAPVAARPARSPLLRLSTLEDISSPGNALPYAQVAGSEAAIE